MTPKLKQMIQDTAKACARASHDCVLTSTATTACEREITSLVEKILTEVEPTPATPANEVKP